MVLLRPFAEEDNNSLLEIEKLCPQGNDKIAESADKSPDVIARYRLYDNWKVFVAEEGSRVVGWIGWTLKKDQDGEKYGYLVEVIIHPQFRKRGIATELTKKAEMDLKENGASHAYGYVFLHNDASNATFAKNGYSKVGEIKLQAIPIYKKAKVSQEFSIRHANKGDIPGIVNLINEFYASNSYFVPYTAESFETYIKNIPGYGMDNFWIVSSGDKILACAGLWDVSLFEKFYYAKEPTSMKIIGTLLSFLDRFTRMPKIPAENEPFTFHYITCYAFLPGSFDAMSNLIKHLNNIVLKTPSYSIVALLTPDDPLVQVVKKSRPFVETWNVIARSFDGGSTNFDKLYLDIRDFIM